MNHLLPILKTSVSTDAWCDALLQVIATHTVGDRPDLLVPCVKKR